MALIPANLEFGLVLTLRRFLGSNCSTLASNYLIRSSYQVITNSFLLIPFAIFLKSTLRVERSVSPSSTILEACPRISLLFLGVSYIINDLSWFYSSTSTFLEVFEIKSIDLLLFSSNNRLIRGFAIRTSYNPEAYYLNLIFIAIKLLIRAFRQ